MFEMAPKFAVGDRVTFRLCDSWNTATGTVTEIQEYGGTGPYDPPRHRYQIRDDRNGWIHSLYGADLKGAS